MPMEEIIAQQPAWIGIWLNVLLLGAFILPFALFIWRQSRIIALVSIVAAVLSGLGIEWMYQQMGYVKLLGLPHILLWTPLVIYLVAQLRKPDLPRWPRGIIMAILATILISLAFDYTDVARYFIGERTPFPGSI